MSTTDTTKALQLALVALESCDCQHPSDGGRQWYDEKAVAAAEEAVRAALAAQEQAGFVRVPKYLTAAMIEVLESGDCDWADLLAAAEVITEAEYEALSRFDTLAAQEQAEPVAWTLTETLEKRETTTTGYLWFTDPKNSAWSPLYPHPPAAHVPEAAAPAAQPVAVPDDFELEQMAASACQEALAFGVSEAAFMKLARAVRSASLAAAQKGGA